MRDLGILVSIGLGGAVGAICRHTIAHLAGKHLGHGFPWGTVIANLIGCFFIGLVLTLAEGSDRLSPHVKAMIVTGLLGALTTFSAFGWEVTSALRSGQHGLAVGAVAANLLLGLACVLVGIVVAGRLSP